ncbi:class I SAM-dependent methyltransferase [Photobacterium rosenbergii]|uniref:class I SAM-dependent methyltransferase n=1 Tax=Photobacterium rosenbergii TaxID=294936 RepID=UPI001C995CEC|nr:class I SAM-dependent methyltransferase [Photobacterium rosenbergii]MBY5947293.1 class I SAM-dependent methyltransferase [Photobacterium rosenbergii]
MEIYKNSWEASYEREENHIFFPKEQCVKFLSRFIGKRIGREGVDFYEHHFAGAQALDFGCGIGTQTKLLADFGLIPTGVDISQTALAKAQEVYPEIADSFCLIPGNGKLAFADNQFSVAIAESVLDSMHYEVAKKSLSELDRVTDGYVFISLIGAPMSHSSSLEEQVQTSHEFGTIQSYFDKAKTAALLENTQFRIVYQNTVTDFNDLAGQLYDARTFIVLSNRATESNV